MVRIDEILVLGRKRMEMFYRNRSEKVWYECVACSATVALEDRFCRMCGEKMAVKEREIIRRETVP